jgi:3',5'-cyclic AMP phosphodiesterase CpdA
VRTIAHLSDLHFGTEERAIVRGLLDDLGRRAPALVVVSGDLTQRARRAQYRAARAFLDRLPAPWLAVPGNHDVPLYDVVRRLVDPLGRYRRFISGDLTPEYHDDEMTVIGLNSARAFTWKSGWLSSEQIAHLERRVCPLAPERFTVIVTHHPFIPPPGEAHAGITLLGGAEDTLRVLDRCEADLLLAGHLHRGYSGDVRSYYPATSRSISPTPGARRTAWRAPPGSAPPRPPRRYRAAGPHRRPSRSAPGPTARPPRSTPVAPVPAARADPPAACRGAWRASRPHARRGAARAVV